VQRENLVEPGDFEHLPHQAGHAADPEFSAFVSRLLGDRNDRTKSQAADVGEIGQVDDDARKPVCDAGFALQLKLMCILGVHAARNMQYNLIANLCLFNGHNIPRVPYGVLNVNCKNFQHGLPVRRKSRIISHPRPHFHEILYGPSLRLQAKEKARCARFFSAITRGES
jgi:hypothetical protein